MTPVETAINLSFFALARFDLLSTTLLVDHHISFFNSFDTCS
ncbi:hypothetical protein OH492_22595 [Vibrio chagasii]|nr:hypothetical protein [Vibrio chagasii]